MLAKKTRFLFAKYKIPIILLKDFEKLGLRGEIVEMKPKMARLYFLKKSLGAIAYPGRRVAMFPNFDEDLINNLKNEKKQ